jgi:hypothetical protein
MAEQPGKKLNDYAPFIASIIIKGDIQRSS